MTNEYYYSKQNEFRKQRSNESFMDFLDAYHAFMIGMGYISKELS